MSEFNEMHQLRLRREENERIKMVAVHYALEDCVDDHERYLRRHEICERVIDTANRAAEELDNSSKPQFDLVFDRFTPTQKQPFSDGPEHAIASVWEIQRHLFNYDRIFLATTGDIIGVNRDGRTIQAINLFEESLGDVLYFEWRLNDIITHEPYNISEE